MIYIVGENLSKWALLEELKHCWRSGIVVGLDSETEGINPRDHAAASGHGRIVCWSISTPRYDQVFLWADQLEYFKPWLESSAPKTGHNIFSFDFHMFMNHGIRLGGIVSDTLRLSRLLYSCKQRSHRLEDLAQNWLGVEQSKLKDLFMRPRHTLEQQNPKKTKAGVVTWLEYLETKRKVGPHVKVPTLIARGEIGKFGLAKELIPWSEIITNYPERLPALYEYATLDASITRALHAKFMTELAKVEWKVQK